MSLSKNIVRARTKAGLTQAELARKLNKSRSSVNEYETGDHEPKLAVIARIAKLTNSSLEELLGSGTDARRPPGGRISTTSDRKARPLLSPDVVARSSEDLEIEIKRAQELTQKALGLTSKAKTQPGVSPLATDLVPSEKVPMLICHCGFSASIMPGTAVWHRAHKKRHLQVLPNTDAATLQRLDRIISAHEELELAQKAKSA